MQTNLAAVMRRWLYVACIFCSITVMPWTACGQGITVPRLIDSERLKALLEYVAPSDEQKGAIAQMHGEYLRNWSEQFSKDIFELNALWQNTYVQPKDFVGESMSKSFSTLKSRADQIRFRLKGANDTFLDQIEAILGEGQLNGMQRMRMAVERLGLRRSKFGIPEKEIDIIEFLETVALDPEERALVDAFILYNEPAYVALLASVADGDERRAGIEFQILDVARMYDDNFIPPQAIDEMSTLRERAGKLNINAWKRLVAANRSMLGQVTSILPGETAARINSRYAELAYPDVIPDPAHAGTLYARALDIPTLSEDQRTALTALRDEYEAKHSSLEKQMCESVYRREVLIFQGHRTNQIDARAEQEAGVAIGVQREELDLAQVKAIGSILVPEQLTLLPTWPFADESPPRPWDPSWRPIDKKKPTTRAVDPVQ